MFDGLLRPSFPKTAIGFSEDSISAVLIRKRGREFTVSNAATSIIGPDVLTPSFEDSNIPSISTLTGALEALAMDAGLGNQKKWSVALPTAASRTSIINLDEVPGSRSELNEVLDWKTETTFGVPAKEMRISRIEIPSSTGKRFVASGIKLAVLEEYETAFSELRWKTGLILPKIMGEAQWVAGMDGDSLVISTESDGFTALLMRDKTPVVVRSVTCGTEEIDDEVYRLLVYYQDRVANADSSRLERMLVVGSALSTEKLNEIAQEALGETLHIVGSSEVGFDIPAGGLEFADLAGAGGLATVGMR